MRFRICIFALALAAAGCADAPRSMAPGEASAFLAQFAAGAAPADICTPQGRQMLRGAVRAYGAAMARNGALWPISDGADQLDISVLVAFGAGFVERSDFPAPARAQLRRIQGWPHIADMRAATSIACADVAALQQAAARLVLEMKRLEDAPGAGAADRWVARQRMRIALAQRRSMDLAAMLQARISESRSL